MYRARFRFMLDPRSRISGTGQSTELVGTEGGGPVTLQSAKQETPIDNAVDFVLRSAQFETEVEANECGGKLESSIALVGVSRAIGLDSGERFGGGGITKYGAKLLIPDCDVLNDRPGLTVYEDKVSTRFFSMTASFRKTTPAEIIRRDFARFFGASARLSQRQLLSAQLYCASQFEALRTRFITLVMAVEVLAERSRRSEGALLFLNDVDAQLIASHLSDEEKSALRSGLRDLREVSIGRSGRNMIARFLAGRTYGGSDGSAFFGKCYRIRSELVHDGHAEQPDAVRESLGELDRMVADLILANAGFARDTAGTSGASSAT